MWKWPFLRHFTAENDTESWQCRLICGMSMSQAQTITDSPFDNYNSTFWTSTTWKTVKIAIFTAFYGKKWHWMMTASLEFWHEYVSESNYYCLTVLPPISAVCEHENPKKTVKKALFTSFYVILRLCVDNSFPNVLYNFFWLLYNICDWFRAKNLHFDQISQIAWG